MKAAEKHLLILDPLLDELAPLGYFRKGRQLWHVNWQEGYAILIETELYMRGTYKNILIQYGSFWKDVDARSRKPVSLGSLLVLDDRCIPFNTCSFDTVEELECIVRNSAPYLISQFKQQALPILRAIHDLPSFVQACEALDALQPPGIWPTPARVWDYLALSGREAAGAHLRNLLQRSLRRESEQVIASCPSEEQAAIRRWNEERAARMDHIERIKHAQIQTVLQELEALQDDELASRLQERRTRTEAALAAYLGPRCHKQQ